MRPPIKSRIRAQRWPNQCGWWRSRAAGPRAQAHDGLTGLQTPGRGPLPAQQARGKHRRAANSGKKVTNARHRKQQGGTPRLLRKSFQDVPRQPLESQEERSHGQGVGATVARGWVAPRGAGVRPRPAWIHSYCPYFTCWDFLTIANVQVD